MRKKWILLAESNALETDLTARGLAATLAPPEVVVARNGVEVLDCLCRHNRFDSRAPGSPALVLLGLDLKGMDGWEVLSQIKSNPVLRTIPVVIFAASTRPDDVARSYQLGANAYVIKLPGARQMAAALEYLRAFWIVSNVPPPEDADTGKAESESLLPAAA